MIFSTQGGGAVLATCHSCHSHRHPKYQLHHQYMMTEMIIFIKNQINRKYFDTSAHEIIWISEDQIVYVVQAAAPDQ